MTHNPLHKKLRLKPGLSALVVSAPEGYRESLEPLPAGVAVAGEFGGSFDWVQVFVRDQAGLAEVAQEAVSALKPGGLLWVCFPKGASKMQTDLTRDRGWEPLAPFELKWTNLVSIDADWSAFSLRHFKPGEERKTWR